MTRAINVACGTVIMPCHKPKHHRLLPDFLYTDPIAWDNVDWNAEPGVNKVVDLFNYPWEGLEESVYDYAILAHIAEHIPHHIVWKGEFVHRHPDYQDGWFAFFAQLWRAMKPGGMVWVLSPYAFSQGAITDPTHTRYLTPAVFNYFNTNDNDSTFKYRMLQKWQVNLERFLFTPHEASIELLERRRLWFEAVGALATEGDQATAPPPVIEWADIIHKLATTNLNMIADFCVEMVAVKDEDQHQESAAERNSVGGLAPGVDGDARPRIRAESVAGDGAAG
jgi:hypothetical protein